MNLFDRLLTLAFSEQSGRFIAEDGSVQNITGAFDSLGGVATVSELQHAIHHGKAFSISTLSSVAGATTTNFLFNVGALEVHLSEALFDFSDGGLEVRLYEGATVSANGSAKSVINLKRVAPIGEIITTVYEAPTVTTPGVELAVLPVNGTTKSPASGTIAGGRVLAPNTKYLISIKNNNAVVTVTFGMTILAHEHTV